MSDELVIAIADDDEGHALLIKKNLKRAGISNTFLFFKDGKEVLDYFQELTAKTNELSKKYLLLLDIRMPKINGIEVLTHLKKDERLKHIPVIMVTTTDDPQEIDHCHGLGCNVYLVKPVMYDRFVNAIQQLGLFLSVVAVPTLDEGNK